MYENVPRIKEAVRLLWGEEDIVPPGVVLFNDRPEFYALKRERLWTTGPISIAAGAGRPSLEVSNDAVAQGTLVVVVTECKLINPVIGTYSLRFDAAGAAGPTANLSRDPRNSGIQSKNRIQNALGASGVEVDQGGQPAANVETRVVSALPFILTQGHRLTVFGVAAAIMTAIFAGYEFNARAEELGI